MLLVARSWHVNTTSGKVDGCLPGNLRGVVDEVTAFAEAVEAKVPNLTLDYEELSLGVQQLSRNALNITVVMPFCSNDVAFLK